MNEKNNKTNQQKQKQTIIISGMYDWNSRFQHSLELPETTAEQIQYKYQQLRTVSQDFVSIVKLYGRVILAELLMCEESKTIKSQLKLGGIAGMYTVQDCILNKANNKEKLYKEKKKYKEKIK